jgi:hypothetical protein
MDKQLPEDINPEWMSVIRRLQSVSKSNGLSVVSIAILVDADGKPISWTAPEKILLEPKSISGALLALALQGENVLK